MKSKTVTLWQVSSRDTVAFVARLLLFFVWLVLLAVIVYVNLGGKKPEESPAEIAFIMASFTAAFLLVIQVRRTKIEKLLKKGTQVTAELVHYSRFQFFTTVGVHFTWRGRLEKKMVQFPSVRTTRILKNRERVVLMVDQDDPGRLIIRELYERENAQVH
jgi:hypothetical protein